MTLTKHVPEPKQVMSFTDQELQTFTGVSITTKRNLEMQGIFVRSQGHLWDAAVSIRNFVDYLKGKKVAKGVAGALEGDDITDADNEYRKQKARKERMMADAMAGKLIEVDAVARQWESHVYAAKAKFTSIPDKLVAELMPLLRDDVMPTEIMDPAKRMVSEALEELSKELEPDDDEEGSDDEDAD
jgi:phage terminase Nu1 subunit (DNA packaging protein)